MPIQPGDYTVGWICATETEFVVACELLDEEYTRKHAPRLLTDHNAYHFGRTHEHNIVIACLPKGRYGTNSAALLASQMLQSFPSIRIGLMVGIGGAAPSSKHDIRLGDVVVSSPTPSHGGVVQYDFGKAIQHQEFSVTGHLSAPPRVLLNALTAIHAQHERKGHRIMATIDDMIKKNNRLEKKYSHPAAKLDKLYTVQYDHHAQENCDCLQIEHTPDVLPDFLIPRRARLPNEDDPAIHYGLVASANTLVKDGFLRDRLIKNHDILCFEMEAAGVMNDFPCVVIRGISDYSDTHKNDLWQGFAAAAAAAYAKELLEIIPGTEVQDAPIDEHEKSSSSEPSKASGIEQKQTSAQADAQENKDINNPDKEEVTTGFTDEDNYYKILGVPDDASTPTIRSAWRKLVLKNHPDKFLDNEAQRQRQQDIFWRIQRAYDTLGDERSRERYDSSLRVEEFVRTRNKTMPVREPEMHLYSRPGFENRRSGTLSEASRPRNGHGMSTPVFEEIRPRKKDGWSTLYGETQEATRPRHYKSAQASPKFGGFDDGFIRTGYQVEQDHPSVRTTNESRATTANMANTFGYVGRDDRERTMKPRESPRLLSRTSSQGSHDESRRAHARPPVSRKGSPASQDEIRRSRVPSSNSRRGSPASQDENPYVSRRSRTGSYSDVVPPRRRSHESEPRPMSQRGSSIVAAAEYIAKSLGRNAPPDRETSSRFRERPSQSSSMPPRPSVPSFSAPNRDSTSRSTAYRPYSESPTDFMPPLKTAGEVSRRRRRKHRTYREGDTADVMSTTGQYGDSTSDTDSELDAFMKGLSRTTRRSDTMPLKAKGLEDHRPERTDIVGAEPESGYPPKRTRPRTTFHFNYDVNDDQNDITKPAVRRSATMPSKAKENKPNPSANSGTTREQQIQENIPAKQPRPYYRPEVSSSEESESQIDSFLEDWQERLSKVAFRPVNDKAQQSAASVPSGSVPPRKQESSPSKRDLAAKVESEPED